MRAFSSTAAVARSCSMISGGGVLSMRLRAAVCDIANSSSVKRSLSLIVGITSPL